MRSLLVLILLLASCGGNKKGSVTAADVESALAKGKQREQMKQNPTVLAGVGFGEIRFGMSIDDVIAKLGPPTKRHDWPTSVVLNYVNKGIELLVKNDGGVDRISIFSSDHAPKKHRAQKYGTNTDAITPQGVMLGDSLRSVRERLGPDTYPDLVRRNLESARLGRPEEHAVAVSFKGLSVSINAKTEQVFQIDISK